MSLSDDLAWSIWNTQEGLWRLFLSCGLVNIVKLLSVKITICQLLSPKHRRDPWEWQWTNRHIMDHYYPSMRCNLSYIDIWLKCPTSRAIWSSISSWCSWSAMNPSCWRVTGDLETWFFELAGTSNSPAAKGACSLAILVTWTICCERNRESSMRKWSQQQESSMKLKRHLGCGFRLVLNT